MRDYLYISDAKVDAYLGQMRKTEQKRLSAALGFNVGILQGSAGVDMTLADNRIKRLEAVERKIRKVKPLGPVDEGKPWIEDSAVVVPAAFSKESNMMFFFSSTESYFLGLAGSAHHVIGDLRPETATSSMSHLHSLIQNLESIDTTESGAFVVDKSDEEVTRSVYLGVTQSGLAPSWLKIMDQISQQDQIAGKPTQSVSFLARRLTSDAFSDGGRRYVLATPLYMTEDEIT